MMTSRRVLLAALAFVASAASIASVAVSADTADQQVVDLPCSMLPHGCKPGTQVESSVEAGGSEESAYCASQLGACIKKCNFDSRCTGQCMFADFECQKKSPASLSSPVVTYPLLSSSAASVGESWCEQQCNNAPNAAQCMARCRRIAVGISSSSKSELAIVYNCAWAHAEMERCGNEYNAHRSSPNVDDEYEACIRVPSATIQNDPKCTFPALASKVTVASSSSESSSVSDPLTGVRECVKECKNKGKDASNACKHEKFAKRAQCYAQVPNTVKACEAGCNRKPHLASGVQVAGVPDATEVEIVHRRPLLGADGDCVRCDTNYQKKCLPPCNGWIDCQARCYSDHYNCLMSHGC